MPYVLRKNPRILCLNLILPKEDNDPTTPPSLILNIEGARDHVKLFFDDAGLLLFLVALHLNKNFPEIFK